MTLHERIAKALGWSVKDCQSFSLPSLRELVRSLGGHDTLVAEIAATVQGGHHIRGTPLTRRRRP